MPTKPFKSFETLIEEIDGTVCTALFLATNPPDNLKLTEKEKAKLSEIRDKLVDVRTVSLHWGKYTHADFPRPASPILIKTWQEAKALMLRDGPSSDDTMARVTLSDGTKVFRQLRSGRWIANDHPLVHVGNDIGAHFVGENGGYVSYQMTAMFALAADADRASKINKGDVYNITAGFEDGSAEAKGQKKLGKKYPEIQKAILSFF